MTSEETFALFGAWDAQGEHSPVSRPPKASDGDVAALIQAAAKGDRRAQAQVLERALPRVSTVARALVHDPEDRDDAVQEVSIQILRSLSGYRGEGGFEAWVGRIAKRHVVRGAEAKRRRWWRSQPVEPEVLEGAAEEQALELPGEALPRELQHYLRELPEVQRQALVLRFAFGHSLVEIAELTGVGESTVRGRIRLASASLRKAIRRDLALGSISGPTSKGETQ